MDGRRCTLPVGEAGRILDRLSGLEEVISHACIEQVVREAGLKQGRSCPLTYEVLLWVVVAMGIFTDSPVRQVFRQCRRFQKWGKIPTRSALCRGRQRLGTKAIRLLFVAIVALLAVPEVPGGFYHGFRLMGIDGSVFTTPDTPANERAFGRTSRRVFLHQPRRISSSGKGEPGRSRVARRKGLRGAASQPWRAHHGNAAGQALYARDARVSGCGVFRISPAPADHEQWRRVPCQCVQHPSFRIDRRVVGWILSDKNLSDGAGP